VSAALPYYRTHKCRCRTKLLGVPRRFSAERSDQDVPGQNGGGKHVGGLDLNVVQVLEAKSLQVAILWSSP
jgi:hypothetical protein